MCALPDGSWLLTLTGCALVDADEVTDPDGDGVYWPEDCANGDPAVTERAWHRDGDGDGFGDPGQATSSCAQPEGYVSAGAERTDCDDGDAARFPGNPEICDGLDNDCDLAVPEDEQDFDGDGLAACEGDCDDQSAFIYAGTGACFYGVDGDCDASPDGCVAPLAAGPTYTGESMSDAAGWSVAGAGDVDGDGRPDLLIGANSESSAGSYAGATYLVSGGGPEMTRSLGDAATARLYGETSYDRSGYAVAGAGDVNRDGLADILIGAPYEETGGASAGAVYLLRGPVSGDHSLAEAALKVVGQSDYAQVGQSLSPAGDADGDGQLEFLIGAPGVYAGALRTGAAYLFPGAAVGLHSLGDASLQVLGEEESDQVGWSVAGGGDADGDGLSDLLLGAPGSNARGADSGVVYLVGGGAAGTVDLADVPALRGANEGDYAGWSVSWAGDVDGDGLDDLLVGAVGWEDFTGVAYLVTGGVDSSSPLEAATASFAGEGAGATAGWSLDGAGDVDGDGFADLLIGSNSYSGKLKSPGAAYLILGSEDPGGAFSLGEADVKFLGETRYDYAGTSVSGAGDVNGDGLDDQLVGAPYAAIGGDESGAAFLLLGF